MKTYLRVLETIESNGLKAWLVGDPVREIAMGIQPMTLSVVTEFCDLGTLANSLGGGTVMGVDAFPVLHASLQGSKVEISCMKGSSIEEDLARRDFSMNAIAIRSDGVFVDPFDGRRDIRNGLIRLTGDDVELVRYDPIRIVRMLRFSAELEMDIFWKTEADVRVFIAQNAEHIAKTPPERWGREILNGMRRRPYDFVYLCDRYHLMPLFLEAVEELKGIEVRDSPSASPQTLFEHTLDTVRIVQDFLSRRKRRETDVAFALSALFHHVGSESSQPLDTRKAGEIADRYLKAWNVDADARARVLAVVGNYRLAYSPITEEKLCQAVLEYGLDVVEMIIDFSICNSQADHMKNMEVLAANKWKLGEVLRRFEETKRRTEGALRYLSGDEVMGILHLNPGKVVGELLRELDIAVGTGTVSSKKEATDWVLQRGSGEKHP